jgi:predicted small secreted protein
LARRNGSERTREGRTSARLLAFALAGTLLLAGCATFRGAGQAQDLAGRTLRMETARGQVTTLRFRDDGRVRADFGQRSLDGRWRVEQRQLCFYWPRAPRECWPYGQPFERGRTQSITSDRGNVVRVTML